jgi:hypothetical protein
VVDNAPVLGSYNWEYLILCDYSCYTRQASRNGMLSSHLPSSKARHYNKKNL